MYEHWNMIQCSRSSYRLQTFATLCCSKLIQDMIKRNSVQQIALQTQQFQCSQSFVSHCAAQLALEHYEVYQLNLETKKLRFLESNVQT